MPRRYHVYPPEFQVLNVLSSAGASILGRRLRAAGLLFPLLAVQVAQKAGANPWKRHRPRVDDAVAAAAGELPETPIVTEGAYAYSKREIKVA